MIFDQQHVFHFLSQYGYWVIFPLMYLEGPVVTIFAAILASVGILNVGLVWLMSVFGDLLADIMWYKIGQHWGLNFARKIGKYIGITEKRIIKMEKYFQKHGGKTVFLAKSTTGLCLITFIAAGIVKMPLKKFVWYSFLGGIVWSTILVSVGYFYGYMWKEISRSIDWIGWVIFLLALATFLLINLFKSRRAKKFFGNILKNSS